MAAPWLFSIYIFTLAYKMTKAIYTWYHFKKQYILGLQKPSIELKLFTSIKAHHFGIKRKVILWLSNNINTPVTFGFFRPVILLPVALLNNIDIKQAETLVLHELSHIKTNDYLLNWFLIIAENIFFYNLFVIDICKKIRLEREKFCDINVLAYEYSPALYADTLLKAERIKGSVPGFHLTAVNRKNQLLDRIRFFTRTKEIKQHGQLHLFAPILGVLFLAIIFSMFLFRSSGKDYPATGINLPEAISSTAGIVSGNPVIVYSILKDVKPPLTETIATDVEKQASRIEKLNSKLQTLTSIAELKAGEMDEWMNRNLIKPVSVNENDASRDIIVNEESSGTATVKVFHLSFENGKWILKPKWKLTAKEINNDDDWDSTEKKEFSQQ